ncbi:ATP-dependent Clp protease ATP-binding subunit clpX [Pyricularia oryzae Y34]|uniref:ATP-dependent Clp protease ATP-binding subunit clpX n=2 Tax=Pyricularia oryzae TaxID=318829 RepID=A0AA97P7E7_PYRO3|nr:ATP-dependent Clp protease ATP-binding subunit clpX [Pyricularia oryzae Y34]
MSVFTRSCSSCPRLLTNHVATHAGSRSFSVSCRAPAASRRTQDFGSGYTSSYDPEESGRGPMFSKPSFGVPQFYPRDLKRRLDEFVVGQERAKKTTTSVVFNHYQGQRRRQNIEDERRVEEERLLRQQHFQRARREPHPAEGQGHPESKLERPTGVGKTYIVEHLNVPFTISDCNSFTQAGYIGQDVEACIERLLIEADYDVNAAENGIVVLDEFDKLARRESVNGRDVGGEGVQQALLKLVEGSKVTVNVKDTRSSRSPSPITSNYNGGSQTSQSSPPPGPRVEQITIDTTNILFIFCGAFVGLDKIVLRRVAKPTIGFGSEPIRNGDALPREMYAHLPHQPHMVKPGTSGFTPLDLTTPADLQAFGFIPELIGRIHNICALTPLSLDELLRILTEPRNSLVAQYKALFETYPSRLFFTSRALYAIAERAAKNETGARGLKMEMERVLAEPMFDAPMPYVVIDEACVKGTSKARYWGKDGRLDVDRLLREESDMGQQTGDNASHSYQPYREASQGGA